MSAARLCQRAAMFPEYGAAVTHRARAITESHSVSLGGLHKPQANTAMKIDQIMKSPRMVAKTR
jgi:hypothetical protein